MSWIISEVSSKRKKSAWTYIFWCHAGLEFQHVSEENFFTKSQSKKKKQTTEKKLLKWSENEKVGTISNRLEDEKKETLEKDPCII